MKTDPHRAKESALFEAVEVTGAAWEATQTKKEVASARARKADHDCEAAWAKYQAAADALILFQRDSALSE
jgi:hypothetical protein